MTLESLIDMYGYLAVMLGTFLEGETILVLAGFSALGTLLGNLKHYEVRILAAITGTGILIWAIYFLRRIRSGRSINKFQSEAPLRHKPTRLNCRNKVK
jgi:membrane protein DedA with SNARE-associated domain